MHLVYHPEFCITVVSNFSWVLQSSQDEIQNNGYPKFWEGKQGTIWSRWKWWLLEAYGIFFTAPTIFLFSLLVAWGRGETLYTDIIEIYGGHEHGLGRALLSLFIHSHWTNISRKKMWINFWPLQAVCVAGVWGFLHVPFQRLQRRLDTIVQLSPFWYKCLTQ